MRKRLRLAHASNSQLWGEIVKVKELLAQMESENPEAEVVPTSDESGSISLAVMLPENSYGEPLLENQEAVKTLGAHLNRIENIRLAIGSYFGLPVKVKIHTSPHHEWVELLVKSPTGKTIMTVEISISYVLKKDEFGWERPYVGNGSSEHRRRFNDATPELSGYRCHAHDYERTRSKIDEVIQKLSDAPKWIEVEREHERERDE